MMAPNSSLRPILADPQSRVRFLEICRSGHVRAEGRKIRYCGIQTEGRVSVTRVIETTFQIIPAEDWATLALYDSSDGLRLEGSREFFEPGLVFVDPASGDPLARALVHGPQNILLDEPTNGLDVMAVRTLRALLLKLKASGRCILFSSHVMQEVAAVCDEVVVIAAGKVVACGSPDELRARAGTADLEEAFVRFLEPAGQT